MCYEYVMHHYEGSSYLLEGGLIFLKAVGLQLCSNNNSIILMTTIIFILSGTIIHLCINFVCLQSLCTWRSVASAHSAGRG